MCNKIPMLQSTILIGFLYFLFKIWKAYSLKKTRKKGNTSIIQKLQSQFILTCLWSPWHLVSRPPTPRSYPRLAYGEGWHLLSKKLLCSRNPKHWLPLLNLETISAGLHLCLKDEMSHFSILLWPSHWRFLSETTAN